MHFLDGMLWDDTARCVAVSPDLGSAPTPRGPHSAKGDFRTWSMFSFSVAVRAWLLLLFCRRSWKGGEESTTWRVLLVGFWEESAGVLQCLLGTSAQDLWQQQATLHS